MVSGKASLPGGLSDEREKERDSASPPSSMFSRSIFRMSNASTSSEPPAHTQSSSPSSPRSNAFVRSFSGSKYFESTPTAAPASSAAAVRNGTGVGNRFKSRQSNAMMRLLDANEE